MKRAPLNLILYFSFNYSRLPALVIAIITPLIGANEALATSASLQEQSSLNPEFIAQVTLPSNTDIPEQDLRPREPETLPEELPSAPLPSPEDLIPSPIPPLEIEPRPEQVGDTQCIKDFEFDASTVFSNEELTEAINAAFKEAQLPAVGSFPDCPDGRRLTFPQVLIARTAITELYTENQYITSGAIIPANTPLIDGIVQIKIIEGRLEDIQINGLRRLRSNYISNRLEIAGSAPVNREKLLEGIQLLQLDPLIETIRVDLQAGTIPGTNLLVVEVVESDTFEVTTSLSNSRSPSVGSFRREIAVSEGNLLGLGDAIAVGYVNTDGSNVVTADYTIPVTPRNTTLTLAGSISGNSVIESPFEVLDITSDSSDYSLTLQHPIIQKPEKQLDIGLNISRRFSQTFLGIDDIGPFPLSTGADDQGRTVATAARFYQTWTQSSTKQVIAARSQFSFGLGSFLGGTINGDSSLPDSNFFAWQGQGQWVRSIGSDSLLLLRSNVQLAADPLLSAEKFGLGGQATVRGYRQEELLTDNGVQASAEVRLPIARIPKVDGVLQIAPFLDFGYGWNTNGEDPEDKALLGIGSGLIWRQNNFDARIDFGFPLLPVSGSRDSLQENGIYFSVNYSFL